jgi:hypothetical protein
LTPEGENLRLEVETGPNRRPERGEEGDEQRGQAGRERYQRPVETCSDSSTFRISGRDNRASLPAPARRAERARGDLAVQLELPELRVLEHLAIYALGETVGPIQTVGAPEVGERQHVLDEGNARGVPMQT